MKPHPLLLASLLLALVVPTGCTSLSRMSQVAMDHSLPIGPPKDHPTEVAFSINASPTLNGNPNSLDVAAEQDSALEPSPYAVTLSAGDPYALTEKSGFCSNTCKRNSRPCPRRAGRRRRKRPGALAPGRKRPRQLRRPSSGVDLAAHHKRCLSAGRYAHCHHDPATARRLTAAQHRVPATGAGPGQSAAQYLHPQ